MGLKLNFSQFRKSGSNPRKDSSVSFDDRLRKCTRCAMLLALESVDLGVSTLQTAPHCGVLFPVFCGECLRCCHNQIMATQKFHNSHLCSNWEWIALAISLFSKSWEIRNTIFVYSLRNKYTHCDFQTECSPRRDAVWFDLHFCGLRCGQATISFFFCGSGRLQYVESVRSAAPSLIYRPQKDEFVSSVGVPWDVRAMQS